MEDSTILLPSQLKVVKEDDFNGTYDVEGLYPGYGHTLGNSLRRIILSSLPGAAITSLKIDGADHEYATLEGVQQDVITLLLNLKQVRFRLDTDEPQVAKISIKGAQKVTAADIETPGGLEVLNPEAFVGEVTDKKGGLTIEMTVERGLGFVSKENLKSGDKVDIGTIVVDAVFTPIRKVSYEVENMRVGDRTDHNRLRINIQTDGTLSPREALERSIKIMIRQLRSVLDLKEMMENIPVIEMPTVAAVAAESSEEEVDQTDVLKTRIESVELSTRTLNALNDASIRTIGGLTQKTEDDLLALDGIGNKGVEEIKDMLSGQNLALKE
jgi:DNA-directed RNA polymerase subunit alpha